MRDKESLRYELAECYEQLRYLEEKIADLEAQLNDDIDDDDDYYDDPAFDDLWPEDEDEELDDFEKGNRL